ncbi:hypothetical protein D3C78_1946890 [compost metagenome]
MGFANLVTPITELYIKSKRILVVEQVRVYTCLMDELVCNSASCICLSSPFIIMEQGNIHPGSDKLDRLA